MEESKGIIQKFVGDEGHYKKVMEEADAILHELGTQDINTAIRTLGLRGDADAQRFLAIKRDIDNKLKRNDF